MASLEKKSLRILGQFTFRDSVIYINPYASTKSKSISITQSILRRQMDQTRITKNTVRNQAYILKRAHLVAKDIAQICKLWSRPSHKAIAHYKILPPSIPRRISDTTKEFENIYEWLNQFKRDNIKTLVYYFWGPPGSGKSRRALEEAKATNQPIYYKPRGLWWTDTTSSQT